MSGAAGGKINLPRKTNDKRKKNKQDMGTRTESEKRKRGIEQKRERKRGIEHKRERKRGGEKDGHTKNRIQSTEAAVQKKKAL